MRALIFAVLATLLMQGCGKMIDTRFEECAKGAPSFVALADCQSRTVRDDAAAIGNVAQKARSEARAQRFSQLADDLGERVAVGRLPEATARVVLQRALDELLDAERDDRLTPIRQPSRGVTCSPVGVGGGVSCTQN